MGGKPGWLKLPLDPPLPEADLSQGFSFPEVKTIGSFTGLRDDFLAQAN